MGLNILASCDNIKANIKKSFLDLVQGGGGGENNINSLPKCSTTICSETSKC